MPAWLWGEMKRILLCVVGMSLLPAAWAAAEPAPPPLGSLGGPLGYFCDALSVNGSGHVLVGSGIYLMQPFFVNNPALTITRVFPAGSAIETQVERSEIRHEVEAAPQLWLGYIDNGIGGRVHWSYYRQGTSQSVNVPAASGGEVITLTSATPLGLAAFVDNQGQPATMVVTSKLELQSWDLEAIFDAMSAGWDLRVCGGLRLAHLTQSYHAVGIGDSAGGIGSISSIVFSGHSFDGAGPMMALEARRPFPFWGSYLGMYGNARAALLFGTAKQTAANVFSGFGENAVDVAHDRRDRVLPMAELELGLECCCGIGATRLFGQIGLIAQEWWGAGNASRSTQVNRFGAPTGSGSIVDSDLGFIGTTLRLGLHY